jgi:8-oxo-dGTP pyrophosphatase MutT (NUDIX family)
MVASSILPVTIQNDKLYFLFGKENLMEESSKGWSDFGGRAEKKESLFETALREGSEELTGFLGNSKEMNKMIKKNGGTYNIHTSQKYHIHIFYFPYDENLPKYYNQNHLFLWNKMDKNVLNDSKLFEKIEIGWFSIEDMKRRRSEFRNFYQEITDQIIGDVENIEKFIRKNINKSRKTQKNRKVLE